MVKRKSVEVFLSIGGRDRYLLFRKIIVEEHRAGDPNHACTLVPPGDLSTPTAQTICQTN